MVQHAHPSASKLAWRSFVQHQFHAEDEEDEGENDFLDFIA